MTSTKMNWAKNNRHRMSHMAFGQPEQRVERWAIRRVSDQARMGVAQNKTAARKLANYLTKSATDGEVFEHHRRERGT